jgi:beta-glucanase (GH16 family)
MRKISYTIAMMFLGVLMLSCSSTLNSQSKYKKLVWAEEFNYTGLPDSSKWSYDRGNGCPDICGWGNHELEYYTWNRSENARVEAGHLVIEARKEDMQGAKYTSARMSTRNKGDWKYGRIEVKAQLPAGTGIWPAIWMLPTKWEYGGWPKSGEIDIMENVGYWPDSILGTVHTNAYNGMLGTQKTKGIHTKNISSSFHVYALEWTEDSMSFFVDGQLYNKFLNDKTGFAAWPFDKEFHLLLNVAVGGDWGGKLGVDEKIFPQKMLVDWVRVYQ